MSSEEVQYYPCILVRTLPTVGEALLSLGLSDADATMFTVNAEVNQSAAIVIPSGDDPSAVAIVQQGALFGGNGAHVLLGFLGAMEATPEAAISNWPAKPGDRVMAMEYRANQFGTA